MNEYFINPYSFIPIKNEKPKRFEKEKGELSGFIDVNIDIKSPVFIPNASKMFKEKITIKNTNGTRTEEHNRAVFYSYADLSEKKDGEYDSVKTPEKPVIPGSEIRGMIRNVYEQLTNSCFVHTDENNLPFKRTPEPKVMCIMKWDENNKCWRLYTNISNCCVSGALIKENGGYKLIRSWKGRTDIKEQYKNICNDFKYGEEYTVDYNNSTGAVKINQSGNWHVHIPPMMKGKVIGTGIPTANKQIIYNADSLNNGIVVSKDTLKHFEYVLGDDKDVKGGYTDKTFNKNSDSLKIYSSYLNRYKRKEPLIVYVDKYSIEKNFKNDIIYLSPACMTKEFFGNKIPDILNKQGEHQKCTDIKNACPACRLFGMIGEKGASKGKLRFLDAATDNGIVYGNSVTLPILATPKISSTEFYLKPPKELRYMKNEYEGIWNYDYYATYSKDRDGKPITIRHPYTPKLSGRKVYLGGKEKTANKSNMNMTVTPIKEGRFSTKIYFEKLTKEELENLLFCVGLEDKCNHKIGHGKPVGYGRIKLSIGEVKTYSYTLENGEVKREETSYESDAQMQQQIKNTEDAKCILEYTSFDGGTMVDYPKASDNKGNETVFKWFTNNRGSVNKPKIKQILHIVNGASNDFKLRK